MTSVVGDPQAFAADAAAGLCDLYPQHLVGVRGGVVRSTATPDGKVAVVVGGGSGHYPAFAGYVGIGMADGAVMGDVFASPSTSHVVSVAREAASGGGVLLTFGNYQGDVINFSAGAQELRAGGIATEVLPLTDDVASASIEESTKRRGVAGLVVVYKVAGAAAEAGYDLAAVTAVAARANERTRTFGVAFSGCTLPGSREPLFELPPGTMGVGLGIHGEPGIDEVPIVGADELARRLVSRLLEERPSDDSKRLAVVLNGLGATKSEELFVLWRYVAPMLRDEGYELVGPRVGEYVTSLDMAGCSLTLSWLDEELEGLWLAPAQTPAFAQGSPVEAARATRTVSADRDEGSWPEASEASRQSAACVARLLRLVHTRMAAEEAELGRLDAVAGDGDHGQAMERGLAAAADIAIAAEAAGAGVSSLLAASADAWAERAGGTSGALWGVALRTWARSYSDSRPIDAADTVAGARAALDAVMDSGKAKVGDKTMIDAFVPFVDALADAIADGKPLAAAWRAAAAVALRAADETADMAPRIGRARPLAERSVGHRDPGAVSFSLCVEAVAGAIVDDGEGATPDPAGDD